MRFLDAVRPEQLAALEAIAGRRRYRAGEALFREGDPGREVLLIVAGRTKISCVTPGGREALLGIREAGDLLGEMAAFDGGRRSATATALGPVEALAVPCDAFMAFVDRTPGVATVLLRMIARRLVDADRKRIEFVAQDTVGRVCARLLELASRFGEPVPDGVRISEAITQEELAGWTGSSREAVIKALRALRDNGWIATGRREITVRDAAALEHRARMPAGG